MSTTPNDDDKIKILRQELIKEMDIGLDHVDKILDQTKATGITAAIMHAVEKLVFSYFARDTVRDKTISQMEIIFEAAKEYKAGTQMQDLGKKYFKDYLHNDETYHRCEKKHAKFKIIVDNIKLSFESRVLQTAQILANGNGSSYGELVRTSFSSKAEARDFLTRELQCVKNEIDVLSGHPEILKIPVAKQRILEIIIKGYEYALERVYSNLDTFYS
nr:hypothetical protein [Candidatus Sigynarchaeota archaeon]